MRSKYTQRFTNVIAYSKEESERLQNNYVGPEHLMLGMIREGNGLAIELLEAFGIDIQALKQRIDQTIQMVKKEVDEGAERQGVVVTKSTDKILRESFVEAKIFNTGDVDTQHLLLAMLKSGDNLPSELLKKEDITYDDLLSFLEEHCEEAGFSHNDETMGPDFTNDDEEEEEEDMEELTSFRQSSKAEQAQSGKGNSETPVLNNFGTDITLAAAENRLDPIVGREKEIERIAQILSRRKKNNPIDRKSIV